MLPILDLVLNYPICSDQIDLILSFDRLAVLLSLQTVVVLLADTCRVNAIINICVLLDNEEECIFKILN